MNSIKRLVAAVVIGWAFCGLHAASVSDIRTTTHYPWNGVVDVSYVVSGVEAGSECDLSAIVRVGGKDYAALTTTITEDGVYSFSWDAAKVGFVGRVEDAKVIFTVAEPNFAIVDLSAGPTATKYPVAYRMTVPDATSDIYKTTKLLLKRLGTKYVGVYETTQKQYELVMGVAQTDAVNKQAYFSLYDDKNVEAKRPIERVSYEALTENGGFFDLIASRSGLPFALPTGDEWEAAARGNMPAEKDFNLGLNNYRVITGEATDSTWLPLMGRYIDLWKDGKKVAYGNNNPNRYTDENKGTAIVGSYSANDNGLYDIHGNVAEWTTEENGAGGHVLRGGSWRDSAADCAIGAKRASADADVSQVNLAGFRVFGDAEKMNEGFVHGTTAESSPFAIDVATKARQIRVEDNDGAYAFFYTPEGEDERGWVDVTDAVGTADWKPDHHGINIATNAADETVTAQFNVKALEFTDIVATGYEGVYDGGEHTGSVKTAIKNTTVKYGEKEGVYTLTKPPAYKNANTYTVYYEVSNPFYTTVTGSFTVKITPLTIDADTTKIKLTPDTLIYDRTEQAKTVSKVTVEGAQGELTLTADVDYEVEVTKHTDATYAKDDEETGYKLTITGKGNYKGEKTVDWGIRKAQIDGRMTITPESFVYDGAEKRPTIAKVTAENKTLDLTTDEYLDQTTSEKVAGGPYTAKVISDSKNFEGTATATWSITARDFKTVTVSLDTYEYTYNGQEQKPVVTVTDSGRQDTQTLTEGTDYALSWPDDRVNASEELTITVTGMGNYAAVSKTATYKIKQATIDSLTLNKAELTYNGKEQKVTVKSVVTKNGVEVPTSDYDLTGEVGTNAKEYKAKVTAKVASRNFTGEATAEWTIAQLDLSEPNVVAFIPDPKEFIYIYDGMPKTAAVEKVAIKHPDGMMITNDCKVGFTLENDYIKTNVGKYKLLVNGNGNIKGARTVDWEIKENIEKVEVSLDKSEFVYNSEEQKPTVTVTDSARKDTQTLTEGTDYEIEWPQDCTGASEKLTITIKGKGNYPSLSKTADYKILKAGIETLTLNATSFDFDNTEKNVTVASVTTTNGITVTSDDYDFTGDTKGTDAKTYTAKVTAKAESRNFHGSAEAKWTIAQRSIDNVTITIPNLTYNREVQTPSITVVDAGGNITANDYEYTIEPNEVKLAGDYVVTFTATKAGNYTGTKEVKFKVEKATLQSMALDKETLTYNGKEQQVTVTSVKTANGVTLETSEYDVTGNTGTAAEGYTAKVTLNATGNANFTGGPLTKDWKIDPLDIKGATISVTEPVYDGTEKTVTINSVTKDGLTVTYSVKSGDKGTTVVGGPYTLVVTGNGNFKGDASTTWNLKQATITSVELDGQLVWNGKSETTIKGTEITRKIVTPASKQTQKVIVKADGLTLKDSDYDITDNVQSEAGQYTLSVSAKGNYTGEISDVTWTIKPTPVIITPNVLNPAEMEELFAKGTARIMMATEDGNWTAWFTKHTFKDGVAQPETKASQFRTFNIKERTVVTGWAVSEDGKVSSDKRSVDYKMGMTAEPVSVLQDMSKLPGFEIPVYDDSGLAKTNLVTGLQEPTNFFNNGQLVFLTRGNLNSKGEVIEGTEGEEIYTDGSIAYTLDGTEPVYTNGVLEGTTKIWTNGVSVIAITNTTTVIAKVFGDQYFDSDPITNVFVRERSQFTKPTISYRCDPALMFTAAEETQNIDKLPVEIMLMRNDDDTTFGRLVYSLDAGKTTNEYVSVLTTNASVKIWAWVEDVNYELESSEKATAEFICDGQLAKPTTEFNKDDQALAQYQVAGTKTFKNKKQVIDFKRADSGLTKDTDGVLRYSLDKGVTWTTNVTQITIWGTTNVWVQAVASTQGLADSEICKDTYTQTPATVTKPVISFNKTKTVKQVEVVIESDQGATIYYTLDGTTPIGINQSGTTSTKYTGAFIYDIDVEETLVVTAIAYTEDGAGDFYGRSEVGSGSFTRKETIADVIKSDDPEKQAKSDQPDTSDLPFDNSDNTKWKDSEGTEFDTAWRKDENEATTAGGSSLRSGDVRDGDKGEPERISTLKVKVTGPGKVTFNWKSSTEFVEGDPETMYDFGTFYVDGVAVEYIWGTNDWSEVSYTINETSDAAQVHEFKWTYEKDWMDDEEQAEELGIEDCIWVDDFVWTCVPDMKQMSIVQSPELTYNQNPQSPTFIVTLTNEQGVVVATLQEGKDYTIEATEVAEVGEYDYTLHATGTNYTGSVSGKWAIGQLSITNAIVTLSGGQMYTRKGGKAVEQYATVESIKVGGMELVGDATWTASGTNETECGTYKATITGSVNLTGSVSTNWVIAPRPITTDMITVPTDIVYFGGETNVTTSADFKVVYEGEEIVWTNAVGNLGTNATTYTVMVEAVTNDTLKDYTGSVTKEWTIAKFDFDQYEALPMLMPDAFVYDALPHTTAVERVDAVHPYFGNVAFSNEAWVVSNNVATTVGEYWAYLYPLEDGNFCGGPISNKFVVTEADISLATIELGPTNTYNGVNQTQTFTVKVALAGIEYTLQQGIDYTVTGNIRSQAGKYAFDVKGIGNWKGKKSQNFVLLPAQIDSVTLDPSSVVYDKTEHTPEITVKAGELTAALTADYTATGDLSATNAGTNTITITGSYNPTITSGFTGNFVVPGEDGTTNVTWVIEQRDAESLTVTQDPAEFTYNRTEQKPQVAVTCGTTPFVENEDYKIVWPENCTDASNLTYKVVGIGSVTNEVAMSYEIKPAQIDQLKFQAQPGKPWSCTYDGTKHSPKVAYVKAGNLTLDESEYALTNVGKVNVGDYTSEVTSASRNFSDPDSALSANWKITPKSIEGAEVVVTLKKPIVYTGTEQKIEDANVEKITVKSGSLEVGKCDFTCPKHTDAGDYNDATVTPAAGNKNFTGTAKVQWTIEQRDITAATIEWENARLDWDGSGKTPAIDKVTVGGPDLEAGQTLDFAGTLATLVVDDGDKVEAGRYTSTVTGSVNFKGTTTQAQVWEVVPKAPKITPNDGTGKYTKLTDYITVSINNDPDDQPWSIYYTTNNWAETRKYDIKAGKWDIEGHTVVEAYAVSCDGCVTGKTERCEYFFGKQNKAPTIALTAKAGAEAGRPTPFKGTEVKGAEKLVVSGSDVVTNFYHTGAKVALTRFGTWSEDEIAAEIKEATTDKGLCPLTDGTIWYTVAENGAPIVSPTNYDDGVSKEYKAGDENTWPTLTTNTVIVAKVFGNDLESSVEVTNAFQRLWTTMPKPTITAASTTFHTNVIVSITTNRINILDWTYTNANQKIWITVGDKTPFLYTNAFELTWKDCAGDPEQVTVKAVSKYGEDYIDSEADTKTFTHEKKAFAMPTLTESTEFRHAQPDGFTVSLTNNAPADVGGVLKYSTNGVDWIACGGDDVSTYDFKVFDTTTVKVCVFANDAAHDYYTSETNEATYTYNPYKMVAPTFDKESQTFYDKDFTFTISLPTEDPSAEDYEHIYHGALYYSEDDGASWTAVSGGAKTFTVSETTTVSIKQTLDDHLDSDVVTRKFTRNVKVPTITLVKEDGTPAYVETPAGATNYFHKAFIAMDCTGGDTHVEYTIVEDGQPEKKGTYTDKLPVAGTFTVTAIAKSTGGSESAPITAIYTRKWETLVQPKIMLIDPYGDSRNDFWNTGDRIAITNDETAVAEHAAVLWPTNFTVKYAVYTNSNDTTTVPTGWATFVQGVTTNFFKADTNAVWAVVEADDYLPSTNKVAFIRQLAAIGELTPDMIHFVSPDTRYEVNVSFDTPSAANAIYYTYEITNDEAGVATPWGNEYDVTKSSARFEGAFTVAIRPRQTLIVKARAYCEDDSSENVGVAETNFTARGEVVVGKYTLPWTIADALDFPDPETPFTVSDSIPKKGNTNCVEDTVNFKVGGSSMVFTNLVDNETVTLETMVTGPGTVTFDWRTSCEQGGHGYNHDYLAFSVDGTEVARLDGESGWTNVTFKIDGAMGDVHFLQWSYKKDAAESKYADCAWVDNFKWVGGLQLSDITDDLRDWTKEILGKDNYEAFINPGSANELANWKTVLGWDSAVTGRSYWDCYVLGLDPDDWETDFVANDFEIETTVDIEGKTVPKSVTITWTPCTKAGRTYTLVGKKTLIDADWTILATKDATEDEVDGTITASLLNDVNKDYRFFQLRVRMTTK